MRALVTLLMLWSASALAKAPVFEVRVLGALGGEDESNLSCYLVGAPGKPPPLMIDGGSVVSGLSARDKPVQERVAAAMELLRSLDAVLLTHSHLDHVSGFLLLIPALLSLKRDTPLEIVALPETLEALKTRLLAAPIWLDPTAIPPAAPVAKAAPLPPGTVRSIGPFKVETIALSHTVPSAAYLVTGEGGSYLHLGDTGPTQAVWERARPLLKSGQLRAVAIEESFGSKKQALALQTGHLTPELLLAELGKLAGMEQGEDGPEAFAKRLAPAFKDCPVMAIHIKGSDYDDVVAELQLFKRAGLNVVIPQQARRYLF